MPPIDVGKKFFLASGAAEMWRRHLEISTVVPRKGSSKYCCSGVRAAFGVLNTLVRHRSEFTTNVPIAVESTQEPEVQLICFFFFCFWEVFATETPTSMRQNVSYGLGLDLGNSYLG